MTITDSAASTLPSVPSSIAAQVKDCLGRFSALLVELDAKDDRSLSREIYNSSGRFKIWSSNIGAHRTGRRSLDHRLRDASHLQENVLRLLSGLAENLKDAREISSGARVPWDQLQFSDSDSDDSEDEEDQTESISSQELQHKTEMDQILAGINEAITNLLRLSVAIRNPARHDQWLNFSESFDTTPFEQYDIAHVAAKYPKISGILARRLGTALSRRRCYFKYREEHHNKMAAGLTIEEQQDGKSTIASSLPDKQKASAVSVSMPGDDDNQSDTGFTATSFATSVADTTAVRIPPLPPDADYDRHFECPFCYDIIIVSNRPAWKQHVYSDLQPYMCLWDSCALGRRMFSTRHEWLQHEQEYHGKAWICCFGCPDPFNDPQSMQAHYLSHHSSQTQDQIENVLQASETRKSDRGPYTCPLCSTVVSTTKAYAKHAGRHLRELSLFTLPAYATDEVLADDDSENESERENAIAEDDSDDSSDFLDPPSEPMPQKRTTVTPDRMRWIYRDNSGNTQGPFSGLEMHDWYKAGYFSPTMLVKKQEDPDYEPLAELIRRIGNSREPFLVPQIGIRHELLDAGYVHTKPPGIFPEGYPEYESKGGNTIADEGSENDFGSNAEDKPTVGTEQYDPDQGPRMSPGSQSGRPLAGEWTLEEELADLRLETGRERRERSQSAQDHRAISPDEEYRRRIQMEIKISEREELIKRKMELKYMKDRHERAEEEERIALEEERLRKDWELRHEREPSSDDYDKHMLQMENQRLKEAEEKLEAEYMKARQERDEKEALFERLNKAKELGEEQDEREARKETREAEDERLRGKGRQGSDEEPRIIIEVERSERDRHERAIETVEERHPRGKDRQELEEEAKTTLEEGSRNWSERKRMVDEFVQESVQQLLKADDVLKLQCLSEEQKQKYRPVTDNLWKIMQMQPQGSFEHNQIRQRLQDWSTKLITQERQYRSRLNIEEQQKQKEEEEYSRFLLKQKEHADKEEQKRQKEEDEYERFLLKQRQKLEDDKGFLSNNPPRPTGDQPTYVKVHQEHLDVETLIYHDIPYEIDRSDPNYIIILREMGPKETEVLFEHTRRLRNSGYIAAIPDITDRAADRERRRRQKEEDRRRQEETDHHLAEELAQQEEVTQVRFELERAEERQRNRLLLKEQAQIARERDAAEQREKEERDAELRQQQQTSEYWDPRGGDRYPIRRNSVSDRPGSIPSTAPLPMGLSGNNNRRVSIIQPDPPETSASATTQSHGSNSRPAPSTSQHSYLSEAEKNKADALRLANIKCRICSGSHFTTKCPFKDTLPLAEEATHVEMPDDAPQAGAGGLGSRNFVPPPFRGRGSAGENAMLDATPPFPASALRSIPPPPPPPPPFSTTPPNAPESSTPAEEQSRGRVREQSAALDVLNKSLNLEDDVSNTSLDLENDYSSSSSDTLSDYLLSSESTRERLNKRRLRKAKRELEGVGFEGGIPPNLEEILQGSSEGRVSDIQKVDDQLAPNAPLQADTQTIQRSDEELTDYESNQIPGSVEHAELVEATAKWKSKRVDFRSSDEKLNQDEREVLEMWPKSNDTIEDVDDLEQDLTSPSGEQKPRRLRASCDACSRSKIRCDKVRPTCSRCGTLGIYCNYSPSMRYQPVELDEPVATQEPAKPNPEPIYVPEMGLIYPDEPAFSTAAERPTERVDSPGSKNEAESLQNTLEAPPQAYISTLRPDDEFIQREADRARRRRNPEREGTKAAEQAKERSGSLEALNQEIKPARRVDEDDINFVLEELDSNPGYDSEVEVLRPDHFEDAKSNKSSLKLEEKEFIDKFKELHYDEDSSDEEERQRIYREKKKRWSAGIFKRTHSHTVESDSSDSDIEEALQTPAGLRTKAKQAKEGSDVAVTLNQEAERAIKERAERYRLEREEAERAQREAKEAAEAEEETKKRVEESSGWGSTWGSSLRKETSKQKKMREMKEKKERDYEENEGREKVEREAKEAAEAALQAEKVLEESLGRGSSSNKETLTQKNQREMEEGQALMQAQREEQTKTVLDPDYLGSLGRDRTWGSSFLREKREEEEREERERWERNLEILEREEDERFSREGGASDYMMDTIRATGNQPDHIASRETEEEDVEYIADRNRQRAERREEERKRKKGHDYAESLI